MISINIVKIYGGLGNQLFQYNFGQFLKDKYEIDIFYDISWFSNIPKNNTKNFFELNKIFDISIYNKNIPFQNYYIRSLKKFPPNLRNYFKPKNYFFEDENFHNFIFNYEENFFYGYWQNIKYFEYKKNYEDILKEYFNKNIIENDLYNLIVKNNSVAVHFRGGDYFNKKNNKIFGNICTDEYYYSAIKYFFNTLENPYFFIFSNDMLYAKKFINNKFKNNTRFFFVEGNSNFEDLSLMTICKNIIIANSTFSWWAAYLKNYDNKKVIAPSKWINSDKINNIIFNDWIKINNKGELL